MHLTTHLKPFHVAIPARPGFGPFPAFCPVLPCPSSLPLSLPTLPSLLPYQPGSHCVVLFPLSPLSAHIPPFRGKPAPRRRRARAWRRLHSDGVSIATAPRRVRCCGDAPSQASDVITMGPGMVARVRKRSGAPRRGPGSPSAASASGSHCLGEAGAPGVGPSRVGLTLSPPFPASTSPGLTGGCPGGHAGPVFEQCLPVECCSPTTQLFCLCQGGFPRWTCLTKTSQKPEG